MCYRQLAQKKDGLMEEAVFFDGLYVRGGVRLSESAINVEKGEEIVKNRK